MKGDHLHQLKKVRLQKQITQRTMAEMLGVSPQFYSQIERGINVLSYRNAIQIAEFLKTSTDYLFKDAFLTQVQKETEDRWKHRLQINKE